MRAFLGFGQRRRVWVATLFAFTACGPSLSAETWIESRPAEIRDSIVWSADLEEGSLTDWTADEFQYAGGGVFNTGDAEVSANASDRVAHSGSWSAESLITGAVRAENGNRAVRLMRWTDRAWDDGGDYLPNAMYYSAWFRFPHVYNPNKYAPWDPGDGGWWNIFQFKSDDENGVSQPMWTLNVEHDDDTSQMSLYLFSKFNSPSSYDREDVPSLPAGEWVHLEAFYHSATGNQGTIKVWQDGVQLYSIGNVVTSLGGLSGSDTHPIWGIGNYTDHISGDPAGDGVATIYFDDAVISHLPVSDRVRGDMDADGFVNFADLQPFVLGLLDSVSYEANYARPPEWHGDINQDGVMNFGDLGGIVDLLQPTSARMVQVVPEPAAICTAIAALLVLCRRTNHPPQRNLKTVSCRTQRR